MTQQREKSLLNPQWISEIQKQIPEWVENKKGNRWPKEANEVRRWLAENQPLETPLGEIVGSWVNANYERGGCVLVNSTLCPFLICNKFFIQAPSYWEFGNPEFCFWKPSAGIVITPRMAGAFSEALWKLEEEWEHGITAPRVEIADIPAVYTADGRRSRASELLLSRRYRRRRARHEPVGGALGL